MIDNFTQIRTYLNFDNKNDVYIIEIIQRKKDGNEFIKSQKCLEFIMIDSLETFDKYEPIIINKCTYNNARAYIRLNKRNKKKIALEFLRAITNNVSNESYDFNHKKIYQSVCGKYHSDNNKTWLVDVDNADWDYVRDISLSIMDLYKKSNKEGYNMIMINTLNGYHIICSPFNLQEFKKQYKDVEVHKDNPTLLYFNKK